MNYIKCSRQAAFTIERLGKVKTVISKRLEVECMMEICRTCSSVLQIFFCDVTPHKSAQISLECHVFLQVANLQGNDPKTQLGR